jgi:hypothetical protein
MPGAVAQAGLANDVVPLEKVAETLVAAVGSTRRSTPLHRLPPASPVGAVTPAAPPAPAFGGAW